MELIWIVRYRYVAFLECDLGQSEFTPGGMVALNVVSQPLFGTFFEPFLVNRQLIQNRTAVYTSERALPGSLHRLNDAFLFAITLPLCH